MTNRYFSCRCVLQFIIALLLCIPLHSHSQEPISELQRAYTNATGESRVELALQLAERVGELESGDPRARFTGLLNEAVSLADTIEDTDYQVEVGYRAGKLAWMNGLTEQALTFYKKAIELGENSQSARLPEILYFNAIVYFEAEALDKAAFWLGRCVELAEQIQDLKTLPRCANLLGNTYNKQGLPSRALPLLQRALEIEREAQNLRGLAAITNNLGLSYAKMGAPDKAAEYYLQSLSIEEQQGNVVGEITSLMNVATIYYDDLQEQEAGHEYIDRAIKLATANGVERALPILHINKAAFCLDEKDQQLAQHHYQTALQKAEQLADLQNSVRARLGLGNLALSRSAFAEAIEHYKAASAGAEQLHSEQEKIIANVGIGEALMQMGEAGQAIEFLTPALQSATENKLLAQEMRAVLALANAQAKLNRYQSAFERLQRYSLLLEQQNDQELREAIAQLKTKYETEKKEQQIALLQKDNAINELERQKDKRIQFWLFGFIAMMVITALVLYNRYQAQRKSRLIIHQQNEELSRINQKLEKMSLTDPLTQLPNRRAMSTYFVDELSRLERHGSAFSVVIMDIDHFKKFNDNYGHDCGDFVLVEVARTLKESIRKQDRLCRWGGEEFLLMLPETSLQGARSLAEKLRCKVMETEFFYRAETPEDASSGDVQRLNITMTMGVAEYRDTAESVEKVIKAADENLYRGKQRGRNCVV